MAPGNSSKKNSGSSNNSSPTPTPPPQPGSNIPSGLITHQMTGAFPSDKQPEPIIREESVDQPQPSQDSEWKLLSAHRQKYGPVVYLGKFGGPLKFNVEKHFIRNFVIDFPGCYPLSSFEEDSLEAKRIIQARKFGEKSLYRIYFDNRRSHLTDEEREMFDLELKLLRKLTTEVELYDDTQIAGYRLNADHWFDLNAMLEDRKDTVARNLALKGAGDPKPLYWGLNVSLDYFWNANDFEILLATYCYEVEQFLALIANHMHVDIPKRASSIREGDNMSRNAGSSRSLSPITEEYINPGVGSSVTAAQKILIDKQARKRPHFKDESVNPFANRSASLPISQVGQNVSRLMNPRAQIYSSGKGFSELFDRQPPPHQVTGQLENVSNSAKQSRMQDRIQQNEQDDQRDNEERDRRKERVNRRAQAPQKNQPSGDPDSDPSDSDDSDHGRSNRTPLKPTPKRNSNPLSSKSTNTPPIAAFDNRLKVDIIPTWDGNSDTLGRWLRKVNRLSERSDEVYRQLGILVPTRLQGSAEVWYYSLSHDTRLRIEENWDTLREAIGGYFMNRSYLEKQKSRANKMSYRDGNAPKETPTEYFICKRELLELVYNYNDTELINEIMAGAPAAWTAILTPHLYSSIEEFQRIVKFHEENLLATGTVTRGSFNRFSGSHSNNPFYKDSSHSAARVNLVGWSKQSINPPFPKDDSNISPKGTPVSKGGRPCRHCGSGNHWDPECKYARKGEKRARVNFVSMSAEDIEAQEAYDNMYYELVSDNEEDFYSPPPRNLPQ